MGPEGGAALEEIRAIARAMDHGIVSGAYRAAGEAFVDYWNGPGAWARLKPEAQAEFVRYAPKGCLDFRALIDERLPLSAYRRLRIPTLLMVGEHAHAPTELIARKLSEVMTGAQTRTIAGAGHMGPSTHAAAVNTAIVAHIAANQPEAAHAACSTCVRAAA